MNTAAATRLAMSEAGIHWAVPLMDFVDAFRRERDPAAIQSPFATTAEVGEARLDALLAAVIDRLCDELGLETPAWVHKIPGLRAPWFVSNLEGLKAIALVESPAHFRARNIFVLENFLSRV